MNKISVTYSDLEFLNKLTKEGDDARRKLSGTMITFYGAVSSGLFILSSGSNLRLDSYERIYFAIFALTAVAIVLLSLLEGAADYFAKIQVGKMHAKRIRENKTRAASMLSPNKFTGWALTFIPWTILLLVIINIISVGVYFVSRIF